MKLSYSRYVKDARRPRPRHAGPVGPAADHPDARGHGVFQQKFLNAVQSSIGGGTDEIQRNIIGERVLGLPARAAVGDGARPMTTLTKGQAARRQRVVAAAMELGSAGGYDAVQMRDVATTADVALGTIYRYFSSKDHLLAEALVEWVRDLGRRVQARPPRGGTRRRAGRSTSSGGRRGPWRPTRSCPRRSLTALASTDPHAARCQREVGVVMAETMALAFPRRLRRRRPATTSSAPSATCGSRR